MPRTQYPQIDQLLAELVLRIQAVLGAELQGIYLFGSLVGGDFDEQTSDIDLLVIAKSDISEAQLPNLKTMHNAFAKTHPVWSNRVEVTYVPAKGMRNFKTKSCHIARVSPGEELHVRRMDIAWLMDWYMVQEQGLTLFGARPDAFIPHITKTEFLKSLSDSMNEWPTRAKDAKWVGYQSYIILTVCRNLAALDLGRQVSKIKGGKWASKQFPEWSALIKRAVGWRGSFDRSDSLDTQAQTIRFVDFALNQLGTRSTSSRS